MNTMTIVGDPFSIGESLKKIHKDNPKFKILHMAAAQHFITQGTIMQGSKPVPAVALFITWDGSELVDENGKRLEWQ